MLLALETSGAQPAFALGPVDGHPVCRVLNHQADLAASTCLIGELEQALHDFGFTQGPPSWSAIAVSQGPGAFTGLRVACAVAQGLALAAGSAIVAVPTLLAVAVATWPQATTPIAVVMDARMNERYVAWARPKPRWALDHVQLVAVTDVSVWLHDTRPGTGAWLAAGNGWGAPVDVQVPQVVSPELAEQVKAVWLLGREALQRGDTVDAALISPLYVRDRVAYTSEERASGLGGNPRAALWSSR
jgi:tRNA threonylcarbamoyladenosine biosynthesis protein TsaB